jgi:hypothetical protein
MNRRDVRLSLFAAIAMAVVINVSTPVSLAQQASGVSTAAVGGSGTANYIPIWTSSTKLGNSAISQSGGNVDVNGNINMSGSLLFQGVPVLQFPGGTGGAGNTALGQGAMQSNTSGEENAATGAYALNANTSGVQNTANGYGALQNNTTGVYNTALGWGAMASNTTGGYNVAVGLGALLLATNGFYNTASGFAALEQATGSYNTVSGGNAAQANTTGSNNSAFGTAALNLNTTGNGNTAIGYYAGYNVTGSNNIEIGSGGTSSDNGAIRIGTLGIHTSFFAAGVTGVTTGSNNAVPVVIDSNGQLGTVNSSRRFKEDIQDMGDASTGLMRLRPVTYRYQKPFDDGSKPMQYGLIAEEVEEVYPDLVAHSADGQIQSVKYQVLDTMLLNEVQRQQAEIHGLQHHIQEQQDRMARLEAALAAVTAGSPVR